MDRRLTPATALVAHDSLRGRIAAPRFTAGEEMQLAVPLADLLDAPGGARDRQLLLGEAFTVIDREGDHAFGRAGKDGYCGWLREAALEPAGAATHWVAAPASHLYAGPSVQARDLAALSFGARLAVTGEAGAFAATPKGFVPRAHLRPMGSQLTDPAAAALLFLGTPYLWGGNSRAGIDCSGLVQAALLACGIACPGDSDLQQEVGTALAEDAVPQAGDLWFWKGHVAMLLDAARLIHATGHAMACVIEAALPAAARIAAQGGGPVIARRRPGPAIRSSG